MDYRVSAVPDPFGEYTEVRVAYNDCAAIEVDEYGNIVMMEQPPGAAVPPLLRLPRELVVPLRDALSGVAPPPSGADLREALDIERARVDAVLSSLLGSR